MKQQFSSVNQHAHYKLTVLWIQKDVKLIENDKRGFQMLTQSNQQTHGCVATLATTQTLDVLCLGVALCTLLNNEIQCLVGVVEVQLSIVVVETQHLVKLGSSVLLEARKKVLPKTLAGTNVDTESGNVRFEIRDLLNLVS